MRINQLLEYSQSDQIRRLTDILMAIKAQGITRVNVHQVHIMLDQMGIDLDDDGVQMLLKSIPIVKSFDQKTVWLGNPKPTDDEEMKAPDKRTSDEMIKRMAQKALKSRL